MMITAMSKIEHYDPLGNYVLETGANAVVLARTDMEAYGEMVRESDASGNWAVATSSVGPTGDVGAGSRPRQTTKETDPDTGLRWFGGRWYDSQMGSWISIESNNTDPFNWYRVAPTPPTTGFDPGGNTWWKPHTWSTGTLVVVDLIGGAVVGWIAGPPAVVAVAGIALFTGAGALYNMYMYPGAGTVAANIPAVAGSVMSVVSATGSGYCKAALK